VDALTSGGGRWTAGFGPESPGQAAHAAGVAARDSYGRLLALLAASTSDLASAEDALADAFERALRTWPSHRVPENPEPVPEAAPALAAFAGPGFHMCDPCRCHDSTASRAGKRCADSLNPQTFPRRSGGSAAPRKDYVRRHGPIRGVGV